MSPAQQLRARLAGPGIVVAPGVYDGLSARIAALAGFEAVYVSGGAVARSSGVPDLGLLTMTEVLGRLREVVDAVDVPVIADADTGYGNALNVRRTVREFARLGVAALHLEDQVTPKRCGHYEDKQLISVDEMTGKVRAAVDARGDDGPLLIVRTDAIAAEGFDAAIARAHAYVGAGAEMLFIEAPTSVAQIERVADELPVPLLINMFAGGKTPLMNAQDLARLGFKLMIAPSDLQRAAIRAMQDTARELRENGSTDRLAGRMTTFTERDDIIGLPSYRELESRYA
ncbi:oxaloacetate decarboxylase [Micromonospora sp. DR5-3]|uniref:isocitrate lyase/PEP mutase family protein n=1 Tax=unclassified Micromonospora TaxID=2617518 RepID=UPI0011DC4C6A|nr:MULTISPECIES: oxaloacetate decarboxylase [unclassified Micromonospora]MCW3815893.1 oxaloacetate decarboxylase [Micromonospora sp. DR5-3]TYC24460.1 oxaloacetate decarboxylase [Micromonospora sp. MP36]